MRADLPCQRLNFPLSCVRKSVVSQGILVLRKTMAPGGLTGLWGGASFVVAAFLLGCAGQAAPEPTTPAQPSPAAQAAAEDAKFAAFIHDFRDQAIAAGIKPEIYDASMAGISRNQRVEDLNTQQPEFVRPIWQYLDSAVSPKKIDKGREMMAAYSTTLANLEARFSVPKEILVAIWGEESAYGKEMGSFNMFEALATLAYDGPRKDFARRELIAAMKMEQQEHLSPSQMTSSWAGAFGQTQFVPSEFLKDAVDGDGDGRKDLWNSTADALASAANLLHGADWRMGQPCLYEVSLPKDFAYELTDADAPRPISEWKKMGVKTIYGDDLPQPARRGSEPQPAGIRAAHLVLSGQRRVGQARGRRSSGSRREFPDARPHRVQIRRAQGGAGLDLGQRERLRTRPRAFQHVRGAGDAGL